MRLVFGGLYTFLFFSYIVTGAFITFHLLRYSFHRKVAFFGTIFFLSVLSILLFTNALIFFSLPIEEFIKLPSSLSF
jgi:hypothetical protein